MIYEKHVECLTKEQLTSLQCQKLRVMIDGAFSEIEKYRDLIKTALKNRKHSDYSDDELLKLIMDIKATDKELYHSIDANILHRLDRRLFYIDSTSGSTGTPKSRYCSLEDDLHDTALISRAFASFSVDIDDRVLLYDLGDMTFYTQFTKAMQDLGVKNSFFYGARHDFNNSMAEALVLEPSVIITLPSLLLRSFKAFEEVILKNCTVKKIIYFGEALDKTIIDYLKEKFDIECYSLYGSTDVGWIGAECEAHDGIHVFSDSVLINIENPEKLTENPFTQSADKDMQGEVSYTSLFQVGKPDLKYKNGDRIILTEAPCRCGRTTPRINVLGRSAETFAILGMKVAASEIKDLIFGENNIAGFIQIELSDEDDFTIMNVKLPEYLKAKESELVEKLENRCGLNFYNQMHVLKINLSFVEESYFKNRKIPLVVDNRSKVLK